MARLRGVQETLVLLQKSLEQQEAQNAAAAAAADTETADTARTLELISDAEDLLGALEEKQRARVKSEMAVSPVLPNPLGDIFTPPEPSGADGQYSAPPSSTSSPMTTRARLGSLRANFTPGNLLSIGHIPRSQLKAQAPLQPQGVLPHGEHQRKLSSPGTTVHRAP